MRAQKVMTLIPCLAHAFVPHSAPFRSLADLAKPSKLLLHEHDEQVTMKLPMSRSETLRKVAAACVGGASAWGLTATGVSAKAPVMKLPDDDASKEVQRPNDGGAIPPFTLLPSGVQITDIAVGDGVVVEAGKGVVIKWVMRRSNGYYVSSSAEGDGEPFVYRVGDEKRAIKGLDEGIRGMKAGGTRRIVVPPQLAYVEGCQDGKPGPIPAGLGPKQQINTRKGEPLSFEVKLTKVR
ncbi:unnamed protein product [Ascophyllum nodosum]